MNMKQYYEEYWNRDSDVSDGDVTTPERMRRLVAMVHRHCRPGDPVLDLGCGAGPFTAALQRAGFDAQGFDLADRAIAMARRHHPECKFGLLNPDGTIPAADASFAAVWNSKVIEHVPRRGRVLDGGQSCPQARWRVDPHDSLSRTGQEPARGLRQIRSALRCRGQPYPLLRQTRPGSQSGKDRLPASFL